MSIRPVDFNGMIQNTNEVASIKKNEDQRPEIQQQNIQILTDKEEENASHQVQHLEDKDEEYRYGDKEGDGSGSEKNKKKKKKKEEKESDGKVIVKNAIGSFDMKI